MSFIVDAACVRLGLRAGALVFRNVRVGPASAALRSEIASEALRVRTRFDDPQTIRAHAEVVRFQELLRKVGVNPRREQPSLERLLTYAHKRGDLPVINSLVDAYNLVSIRSSCSLGAHDLDKIALPVSLRLLTRDDTFRPLGAAEEMAVVPGEYGYVDSANRVLCRLDILQAEFSKVTVATSNVLLIIEGTVEHPEAGLRQVFVDAAELITRECGGTVEIVALPSNSQRQASSPEST